MSSEPAKALPAKKSGAGESDSEPEVEFHTWDTSRLLDRPRNPQNTPNPCSSRRASLIDRFRELDCLSGVVRPVNHDSEAPVATSTSASTSVTRNSHGRDAINHPAEDTRDHIDRFISGRARVLPSTGEVIGGSTRALERINSTQNEEVATPERPELSMERLESTLVDVSVPGESSKDVPAKKVPAGVAFLRSLQNQQLGRSSVHQYRSEMLENTLIDVSIPVEPLKNVPTGVRALARIDNMQNQESSVHRYGTERPQRNLVGVSVPDESSMDDFSSTKAVAGSDDAENEEATAPEYGTETLENSLLDVSILDESSNDAAANSWTSLNDRPRRSSFEQTGLSSPEVKKENVRPSGFDMPSFVQYLQQKEQNKRDGRVVSGSEQSMEPWEKLWAEPRLSKYAVEQEANRRIHQKSAEENAERRTREQSLEPQTNSSASGLLDRGKLFVQILRRTEARFKAMEEVKKRQWGIEAAPKVNKTHDTIMQAAFKLEREILEGKIQATEPNPVSPASPGVAIATNLSPIIRGQEIQAPVRSSRAVNPSGLDPRAAAFTPTMSTASSAPATASPPLSVRPLRLAALIQGSGPVSEPEVSLLLSLPSLASADYTDQIPSHLPRVALPLPRPPGLTTRPSRPSSTPRRRSSPPSKQESPLWRQNSLASSVRRRKAS